MKTTTQEIATAFAEAVAAVCGSDKVVEQLNLAADRLKEMGEALDRRGEQDEHPDYRRQARVLLDLWFELEVQSGRVKLQ